MNDTTFYPILHTSSDTIKTDTTLVKIDSVIDTLKKEKNKL